MTQVSGAPLQGVRVLDLTRLLPGPACAMHLADMGAEVVKVEDTGAGDYAWAALRSQVNRNKRGLQLDLKKEEGKALFLDLCEKADVLIEGFRPGVMERLGVGYETVKQRNPAIVYCSMTGYGQTGPYSQAAGHDINYIARAGVADQVGNGAGKPALSNLPLADLLGGASTATIGILAALFDAQRTGKGRLVDISFSDGILAYAGLPMAALNEFGQATPAGITKLTGAEAYYGFYETADHRYIAVGAFEKKFWDEFCELIEREDLKPLHGTLEPEKSDYARQELGRLIAAHDFAWWSAKLDGSDCCVTPVLNLNETACDEHFKERGMIIESSNEKGVTVRQLGSPFKMSGFEFSIHTPSPAAGQHTREVLQDWGVDTQRIRKLLDEKVVVQG
ncbi:CoA transferase [Advenella sp. WQ 585]|uniref:CoA transferase n=1 Tax=Advenella mandrilli TaxID=2800330 RepID=A0ABS1EFX3_9BURK|nr:CaiB/BaiF CoA-transferase family protein [Advenella mandrilli]MBK1781875.1 CoA transferase [Advenella mandrilli]